MIVLPDAEDRMVVSSLDWTKHLNVTDGQTDKQICRGYYSSEQCGRTVKTSYCQIYIKDGWPDNTKINRDKKSRKTRAKYNVECATLNGV